MKHLDHLLGDPQAHDSKVVAQADVFEGFAKTGMRSEIPTRQLRRGRHAKKQVLGNRRLIVIALRIKRFDKICQAVLLEYLPEPFASLDDALSQLWMLVGIDHPQQAETIHVVL